MTEQFCRTEMLIGENSMIKIKGASVAVLGIGGVGSYIVEALARAGIGRLMLVDKDVVDITNLNRQLPALHSTVGKSKVMVMAERIRDINPLCEVIPIEMFFMPETSENISFKGYDYVVDAIDTVTGKLAIIEKAVNEKIPVISCMGTGNKFDPTRFRITEIEKTKVCPLAKVMRKELKKRNISGIKVLYSEEVPYKTGTSVPGSLSFVPSVAGLILAGEVIRDIIKKSV